MRSALGAWLLAAASWMVGCRTPTEITVSVTTDVPCASQQGTEFMVGVAGALEGLRPAAVTMRCEAGPAGAYVGSLVVVPSGADNAEIGVRVVTGVSSPVGSCDQGGDEGCIVARRSLRFLPHTELLLPIEMKRACEGVVCDAASTCEGGRCVPALIVDPSACAAPAGCEAPFPDAGAAGQGGAGGAAGQGGASGACRYDVDTWNDGCSFGP